MDLEPLDPDAVAELARRAKVELRKRARGLRAAIPAAGLAERSARIVARLEADPGLQAARRVGLFWPMERHREVDLRPLFASLRARGALVAFPRVVDRDAPLAFHALERAEDLQPGPMGTLEPPASAPRAEPLDVVVVPCLLVEPGGFRLGYGGGFFDRTLPELCPPAIAVAVAYDFQLAPEVPRTAHDVPVQRIVTDARTLDVPTAAGG